MGLALLALGLGFAVWARVHIGRNWGTPMTQKDQPELVTSGPYSLVRHPIYSGILVAGVGTAVALSWTWLTPMVLAGIYFFYSATVECQWPSCGTHWWPQKSTRLSGSEAQGFSSRPPP